MLLSEVLQGLQLDQQSDKFVRRLRQAVLSGAVTASYSREQIVVPKVHHFKANTSEATRARLKSTQDGNGYQRSTFEMVIQNDDAYRAWYELNVEELRALSRVRQTTPATTPRLYPAHELLNNPELFKQGVLFTKKRLSEQTTQAKILATRDGFRREAAPQGSATEGVAQASTPPAGNAGRGARRRKSETT